jgi:N-methylhydantoinase A
MLAEGELAGGIRLNRNKALEALAGVAQDVGLDSHGAARGVLKIAAAHMADAIREITIERGRDPRSAALLAFGGAGPLLGVLLAQELDIRTVVIPPYAGNFSAWGLLGSDVTRTAAQTRIVRLGSEGLRLASATLSELFAQLELRVEEGIDAGGASKKHAALEMRYVGQEHTLSVPVNFDVSTYAIADNEPAVRARFAGEYERVYSHSLDESVEIVHVRASVEIPLPKIAQAAQAASAELASEPRTWRAYSFSAEEWREFSVVSREAIAASGVSSGPAIVLEETATTYVDEGFDMRVDASKCLILTQRGVGE